jgi:hypothetical protein
VTITPATMRVPLKAGDEALLDIPSAERLSRHQCGSVASSIAVRAPITRKIARISEIEVGLSATH